MNNQQNIPKPAKSIKVAQSTLQDEDKVATFISIHGKQKYLDALEQFAEARHGSGKLDEIEEYLKNHDVSDEEFKKLNKVIEEEQNKMVGPQDEAYAEIKLDGYEVEEQHRERFIKLHGKEKYLKAQGLEGFETANTQALKNIHPNQQGSIDKKRAYQQQLEEAKKKEAQKEAAKQKILDNGQD